jgi:cell division protein FtsL
MKKISKLMRVVVVFIVIFTFGALIVSYVALKKKCEDLIKQEVVAEEELKNQDVWKNNLIARYQNLTSEDRIVLIAAHELGMVIEDPPILIVTIDSEKISDFQTLLQEQYD